MPNNAMIPKKIFDIAFHLFSKSISGIYYLPSYRKELEKGIRSTQYFGKKKIVFLAFSYGVCVEGSFTAHPKIGFILVGIGAKTRNQVRIDLSRLT